MGKNWNNENLEALNDQAGDVAELIAQNVYSAMEYQGIWLGDALSGQLESELHSHITEYLYKWTVEKDQPNDVTKEAEGDDA